MKLYRIVRPGGPDPLELAEQPEQRPGRGQALVEMRAFSLNYRDLMTVGGQYGGQVPAGRVPLSDGAGEVLAVGEGVTRVRPGDRVCPIFCQSWLGGRFREAHGASALGGPIDGVLAEQVVLDAEGLVHVPAHLSFAEAATLPCAAVTAWHSLTAIGQVTAGDTVLVQGSGGVSVFALQFARLMGARVIATSSSEQKLERLRTLGASDGVNYRTTPEWQDTARALTQGVGVDHVVEVGGAGTMARSLQAVRMGGTIGVIGVLTGRAEIDPTTILRRRVGVQGIFVGSREMFEAMNRAISLHAMRPVVDQVFPFEQAPAAFEHLKGTRALRQGRDRAKRVARDQTPAGRRRPGTQCC